MNIGCTSLLTDFQNPWKVQGYSLGELMRYLAFTRGVLLVFVVGCSLEQPPKDIRNLPQRSIKTAKKRSATPPAPARSELPTVPSPSTESLPEKSNEAKSGSEKGEEVSPLTVTKNAPTPALAEPRIDTGQLKELLTKHIRRLPTKLLVSGVYSVLGGEAIFYDDGILSEQGKEVLELVGDVESHGLKPFPYDMTSVKPTLESAEEVAKADVALAAAVTQYFLEFTYVVWADTRRYKRRSINEKRRYIEHLREDKDKLIGQITQLFPEVSQRLKSLWPKHPDYAALRDGLKRYQALRQVKMPLVTGKLAEGKSGKRVVELQKRLAAEGYYDGELNGQYDEAVTKAVLQYQETHQLTPDGKVGRSMRDNLAVGMWYRVKQIKLALQRWREAPTLRSGKSHYVRVNIPAFMLELYKDGERYKTHRAIVGNNKRDEDLIKNKKGRINRTPFFSSVIHQVHLNPVWIVPARIRAKEYQPYAVDAGYYRRKGMRERTTKSGERVLVQSSGKHNALGRVKLLLKRTNGIYLHDTNRRSLFKYTKRAFSHGCVRVENAIELARHVVEVRGGVTMEEFENLAATGKPQKIVIDEPLPVISEYNTMTVDDQGRLVFLNDIYSYDRKIFRVWREAAKLSSL